MSHIDDTSSAEEDSITTIFSTSSQGSMISIMSKNSFDLAKLKTQIDSNSEDLRNETIVLLDDLFEQREKAIRLLHEISERPKFEVHGTQGDSSREDSEESEDSTESKNSAETQTPTIEELGNISSKEMFRRMRQRLTKQQFKQFVRKMKELNKLREERQRRKDRSHMHPLPFSAWPHISINVGEWEVVPVTF